MKNDALKISADAFITVPFHDVDSAQITWHGHYVKYLELARCALLDKLDYNYVQMTESGYFWPVVDLQLRYIAPARFLQEIKVTATLKEWENRLKIDYIITDSKTGERITKASTTQVAVDIESSEMQFVSPQFFIDKVQHYQP